MSSISFLRSTFHNLDATPVSEFNSCNVTTGASLGIRTDYRFVLNNNEAGNVIAKVYIKYPDMSVHEMWGGWNYIDSSMDFGFHIGSKNNNSQIVATEGTYEIVYNELYDSDGNVLAEG